MVINSGRIRDEVAAWLGNLSCCPANKQELIYNVAKRDALFYGLLLNLRAADGASVRGVLCGRWARDNRYMHCTTPLIDLTEFTPVLVHSQTFSRFSSTALYYHLSSSCGSRVFTLYGINPDILILN